jgi:hypothetical protein
MKINFEVISHSAQRYDTVGDYWQDAYGIWQFRVSFMNNWKYELLIFIHELVEWILVRAAEVPIHEIDDFDLEFEARRAEGNMDEPGDDPRAPYHLQHSLATGVERIVAGVLGVSWKIYDEAVMSLEWRPET